MTKDSASQTLSTRYILHVWWPLAASWLFMTTELPLISAVIARLAHPEINLAAWGIVFSTSIIVQSPSTMLLAASTALSQDWDSYQKLRRFMLLIGAGLVTLHAALVFTPLYNLVMEQLIGIPPEISGATRLGLTLMIPWSWGTAYRRFQQGVLIRFDHSHVVILGSVIRVSVDSLVLTSGYLLGSGPGVAVGAASIIAGVLAEDLYTGLRVRPVIQQQLKPAPASKLPLTLRAFLNFYLPLAATMLLMLVVQPIVNAALSRMPNPLDSLAVWPVIFGLLTMWQSTGISYNEAVIALLDQPQAVAVLRRFTWIVFAAVTAGLLVMTATPLAELWFLYVAGLPPPLVELARQSLWLGLLLPGFRLLQSWFQGSLTYSRQTRAITESVALALLTSAVVLWAGVAWGQIDGVYVGVLAMSAGFLLQTLWLWWRSRATLHNIQARDSRPRQSPVPAG